MKSLKLSAIILLTGLVIISGQFPSAYAADCGDELSEGTWKDVVGYHNGAYHAGADPNPDDDIWTCGPLNEYGWSYQCVQYVNKFYHSAGMRESIHSTHGNTYFGNAESFGLASHSNCGSEPPKINDILCYDDGSCGHVAIITGVTLVSENRYRIDLVEQNWSETGAVSVYMDYDPVSETYDVEDRGSYAVQGWLRIPYSCKLHAQNPADTKLVHAGETYTFVVSYENTLAPPATNLLSSASALDWKDGSAKGEDMSAEDLLNFNASSLYFHYMELRSCDSNGNPVESWLYPGDNIWVSNDKIRVVSQSAFNVGYTQSAWFELTAKIPDDAQPDTYDIYFRPYHATGGYLENWGDMHFTLVVTTEDYTVGQNAPADVVDLFVNTYAGNEALLGAPASEVIPAESGFGTSGYYQVFENGSIQVHSANAYIVANEIYDEWGEHGYAKWAGFPVSDAYDSAGNILQDFEGGYIQTDGTEADFISTTHPVNLTAQVQPNNSVVLNWENQIIANGISIYRAASPAQRIAELGPDETSFVDTTAEAGKPYSYFIQAYNDTSGSPLSNQADINLENEFNVILDTSNASGWFGGDDREISKPRNIGIGQSFTTQEDAHLTSIGFKFDRQFDYYSNPSDQGHEVTLVLNLRSNDGMVIKTYEKIVPDTFSGGWILFDIDDQVNANTEYIYTCYLKNGESLELSNGYLANTEDLLQNSKGYDGEITVAGDDIENWSNWELHPWDRCYQVNGYYINSNGDGLDNGPWPMFGHDVRHTRQSTYRISYSPSLKWRYHTAANVASSPAIGSDGTIYVMRHHDWISSNRQIFYAFNQNGTLKWSYSIGSNGGGWSSPAIGLDGTIYVGAGSNDHHLYAFDPEGAVKWTVSTGNDINSSPTIGSDGTIYVGSSDNYLYAINPDGTQKWRFFSGGDIESSPAIGSDGTIYVGSSDGYLYALNPDGTLKWRYSAGDDIYSSPAIGSDGIIYIGSYDNYFYALNPDGTLKWRYITGGDIKSSPAIGSDGTIYVGSYDNYLYALNPDGTLKWRYITGGDIKSSPTIGSDGTIYFGSYDHWLYALNENGTLRWRYLTGSNIYSSPAIGQNGTIYVGSQDGHLYALGLQNGKGEICGKVTDWGTLDPIPNATISVIAGSVKSGTDGAYGIMLDSGVYNITCSRTGYLTTTIPDIVVTAGEFTELNIELNIDGPLNIVTTDLPPAEAGIEYNDRARISGGIYPYTYSIAYGSLPQGLSIDTATGTITGIPASAGTYTFAVGIEDSENSYAEREFSIEVTEQLEIITESPLSRGTRGTEYFNSIEATGGTLPHSFSRISGSLPPGMSLSSGGSLTETPSSSGSYDFTVRVTDASSRTAEKTFHIEIVNPLVISTSQLNDGITGTAYSHTLSASGGYGNYAWSIYSGTLPNGLSLDSATGTISGTPANATFVSIVISVSDEEGRTTYKDLTLQIAEPLEILTSTLPTALWDNLYSEAIRTNGGIGPFTYDYTGQLPAGLSLNSFTGIISGTPTIVGYTNVSITVTDSTWPTNQTVTQNLGIRVTNFLTMTTSAILPNAKKDVAINPIILAAGGGPSPYTWAVTGGYMPEGITLNPATGELSGTPTDSGDFVFTIQVTDSGSDTDTAEKEFFMHVSAELEIITGAIPDGAKDISYSATLEAKGGLLPYSWRIKSGTLPSGLSFNSSGTIYGKPTTRQTYSFTVEVSDNDSPAQTAEQTYIIDIQDDLYVYTISIPNGRIDQAYQATVKASLGTPPYSWRLESGVLPPGLTLTDSPTTATLEGTPSGDGTYVFILEVSDNGTPVKYAVREYTVDIYDDVVVESSGLNSAVRGEPHSDSILVTGGKLPYHFSIIDGSLPAGLTINSSTGHISGTADPVYGYSEEFTVRVLDSGNPSGFADKQFTIYVTNSLAITTGSIQAALQKATYLADLESEGGISPHTWSIMHGLLPEGLALDESTGEISGAPLECGMFNFTVRLEDSSTEPEIATRAYNLDIVCCNDYDISGAIANGIDVTVTLSGDSSGTTTTFTNGSYQFQHLTNGSYTITPSKADYGFEPAFRTITVNNQDVSGADFTMVIIDSDGDGLPDDIEEGWCTDPDDPDTDDDGICDGSEDANHNGVTELGETDPCNPDSDGDKMPDGWEVDNNLNPLVDDAAGDADGDGFSNLREYVAATDPRDIDDTPYFEAEVEDFETGDFSKLAWLTTGDGLWTVTSNNVYNGSYSAESPNIDDAQSASLEVNLYCEAGDMSFWYSVDSEENYDFLKFYIDGALTDQWSGLMPYAQANYTLTTGMHHFKWEYEKDKSDSAGSDTAWIDDISFPGSVDSDSDGMPDGWEIENDLNGISDDSSDDADGDLFTNYKEYMLNTDPMNPADKPALETGFDADFDLDGSDLARFVDGLSSGVLTEADLEEFARNFGK